MLEALMQGFTILESKMCKGGFNDEHREGGGINPVDTWYAEGYVHYYTRHWKNEYLDRPDKLYIEFACPVKANYSRTQLGVVRRTAAADLAVLTLIYKISFYPQNPIQTELFDKKNWAYNWRWSKGAGDNYTEDKASNDIKECLTLAQRKIDSYLVNALHESFGNWKSYPPKSIPLTASAYTVEALINNIFIQLSNADGKPHYYAFKIPFTTSVKLGGGSPEVVNGEVGVSWPAIRLAADSYSLEPNKFSLGLHGQMVFTFDVYLNSEFWSTFCSKIAVNLHLRFDRTGTKRVDYNFALFISNCGSETIVLQDSLTTTLFLESPEAQQSGLIAEPHPYQKAFPHTIFNSLKSQYTLIRNQLERRALVEMGFFSFQEAKLSTQLNLDWENTEVAEFSPEVSKIPARM